MPDGKPLETGTYYGYLKFTEYDVSLVRSIRELGKWEVAIDLMALKYDTYLKAEIKKDEIEYRTAYLARKMDEFLLGADPSEIEGLREIHNLTASLQKTYFKESIVIKYSITEYEAMYKKQLVNIRRQE